ncbi:MAG: glycosyltransferase family 2 protein [Acidobacteriota bacterium]
MAGPKVFVIVLNWNGLRHLDECLGSLLASDYLEMHVIMVDNASADGSADYVREKFPSVILLVNDRNMGFSAGNNVGIRYALAHEADYVVLLNNDTRIEPDCIRRLVECGEDRPEAGVLGGTVLMYFDPGVVNSTGVNLNLWGYGWDRDFGRPYNPERKTPERVLGVTGCLMAIKRDVLKQVGLLDESYFAYYEDLDYCLQVWKATVYEVMTVPSAIVYHKFSASTAHASKRKAYLLMKNQYRLMVLHFSAPRLFAMAAPFCLHRLARLFRGKAAALPEVTYRELVIMSIFLLRLPFVPFERFLRRLRRKERPKRFRSLLTGKKGLPNIQPYLPDHATIVSDAAGHGVLPGDIPSRILMGVNDKILGPGWSKLLDEIPQCRRVENSAVCFLRFERDARFVQVHLFTPPQSQATSLELEVDGEAVGRQRLVMGCHTYHFSVHGKEGEVGKVLLRFNVEGKGLADAAPRVNEIGVLSAGSPSLRVAL